ncbi:MAG: hypothetical protein QXX08_04675 [Candidatus Bathyarchaeia archaeon]
MSNDYKEKILEYLKKAAEPADVEKIRKACGIGNWNTALKHCLELHTRGIILGQRTTKGWVFWSYEETHLVPWQEAIGTLDRIEESETQTIALLTCTHTRQLAIPLPKNQLETKKLQRLIGRKIRVLQTDLPERPLVIKSFNETTAA